MDKRDNPFPQDGKAFTDLDDGLNDRQPFGNFEVILPGGLRNNPVNNNNFGSNHFDAEDERASLVQPAGNPNMRQHDPAKVFG